MTQDTTTMPVMASDTAALVEVTQADAATLESIRAGLQPFAHKSLGSLRIGMDEVRAVLSAISTIQSLTTRITELEPYVEGFRREERRADDLAQRCEELEAENGRLRQAQWFYLGDDCGSDQCRDGIDECISEDFEWHEPAKGDHILQISGGRPVPDMWVALHYFTDAEKDERDDDEPYSYTVHATEEAARATLTENSDDR